MNKYSNRRILVSAVILITGNLIFSSTMAAPLAEGRSDLGTPALDNFDIRAQLSPQRYTTLSSELNAKIESFNVKEGDRVKKGELLVSLDCSIQKAQRDKAKASLNIAKSNYAANSRLYELNAIGKVELNVSLAEQDKALADLQLIQATLSKCAIHAPFSGRVAEQKVQSEQFAKQGTELIEMLDDSILELDFIIPSRWLIWLEVGLKFNVFIDETQKRYPAHIQRLGARVDPISQSIKASAVIEGNFQELIAGMSGRIEITPP